MTKTSRGIDDLHALKMARHLLQNRKEALAFEAPSPKSQDIGGGLVEEFTKKKGKGPIPQGKREPLQAIRKHEWGRGAFSPNSGLEQDMAKEGASPTGSSFVVGRSPGASNAYSNVERQPGEKELKKTKQKLTMRRIEGERKRNKY